jgi:hypothetical protein
MSTSPLSYLFLKIDDEELVDEGDVVPGMVAMPDCQKDEGPGLVTKSIFLSLNKLECSSLV